ncbi:MAG TPA: FxsA family protein [Usitatibacter sp.]|nr:FxsA family protein [Usitatibacter sp.]
MVHVMRAVLIGILLGFPLLEGVVLVRLSQTLGWWWVLAWVLLSACAGMALIKEARFTLLARLAAGLAEGEFSIAALSQSGRTVLAGLLLIFPGVVSDFIAVTLLLLPAPRVPVRQPAARRAVRGMTIEGRFRRGR